MIGLISLVIDIPPNSPPFPVSGSWGGFGTPRPTTSSGGLLERGESGLDGCIPA